MKILNFRIAIALLAFSLGVASVWVTGGFSYLASRFEQTPSTSKTSNQLAETPSESFLHEIESSIASEQKPRFSDYPVAKIYKGKIASLKFPRDGSGDRERLQWAIENQEVNFAGHYILTNWSCGMWCSRVAIIDAKVGKAYWLDGSPEVCFPHLDNEYDCNENFENLEYRIDSKLIAFFGFRYDNNPEGEKGFHYYKFENGRFIYLKSILVKDQRSARQIQIDEFDEKNKP